MVIQILQKTLTIQKCQDQSNCIYVFFAERDTPTKNILKSRYESIFGIGYSLDIQRFRFYPGTKNIYTFIGFVNQNVAKKAIKTLHKIALNRSVFYYPFGPPKEEETVVMMIEFNIKNLKGPYAYTKYKK